MTRSVTRSVTKTPRDRAARVGWMRRRRPGERDEWCQGRRIGRDPDQRRLACPQRFIYLRWTATLAGHRFGLVSVRWCSPGRFPSSRRRPLRGCRQALCCSLQLRQPLTVAAGAASFITAAIRTFVQHRDAHSCTLSEVCSRCRSLVRFGWECGLGQAVGHHHLTDDQSPRQRRGVVGQVEDNLPERVEGPVRGGIVTEPADSTTVIRTYSTGHRGPGRQCVWCAARRTPSDRRR